MSEDVELFLSFSEKDLTVPYHIELYKYWLEQKGSKIMPARADIDINELAHYLSSIVLFDYHKQNNSLIFRVIGTSCVGLYGEQTNKCFNELEGHEQAIKRLLWCVQNKKPYFAIKNMSEMDKDYISTAFIVLPLSDDGENVNKILVSHHFYYKNE